MTDQDYINLARAVSQLQTLVISLQKRMTECVSEDIKTLSQMTWKIAESTEDSDLMDSIRYLVKKRINPDYKPNGIERAKEIVSKTSTIIEDPV